MSFEAHLIRPHGHLPLKGKARGWERRCPKAFPLRGRCPEGNFAFGKVGLAKGQTATAQIEDLRRGTEGADEVNPRLPDKSQFVRISA